MRGFDQPQGLLFRLPPWTIPHRQGELNHRGTEDTERKENERMANASFHLTSTLLGQSGFLSVVFSVCSVPRWFNSKGRL